LALLGVLFDGVFGEGAGDEKSFHGCCLRVLIAIWFLCVCSGVI
jgi:hypothetical protein